MTKPLLEFYRMEIGRENPEAGRWVDNIPRRQWTQAFDDGLRWGHMTTNLAESMNSVLKGTRNLPITALVKSTYFKLVDLFVQRGKQWNAILNSGQTYTEKCMKIINEGVQKSRSHRVTNFDRQSLTFSVQETVNHNEGRPMRDFMVDLLNKCCDCGRFQALHIPCSHVIAACSSVRQSYQVYISEVYQVSTVFNVYNEPFQVIRNEDFWPSFQGITLYANEEMRRTKRGRPSSTRIRTEMDDFTKQPRNCGLCGQPGHNRSKCPNVGGPSTQH
ncbi:hypothetical protein QL285_040946 [Trifolium repens]|nr:hypothetical protein QL285_040946 [Trifolium repens]